MNTLYFRTARESLKMNNIIQRFFQCLFFLLFFSVNDLPQEEQSLAQSQFHKPR